VVRGPQFEKRWFILMHVKKSKGLPRQAEVAQGVPGRLRPWIFLTFRHYKGGRSPAKRTGRFYPCRNPWYSLSEAESTSGHMVMLGAPRKKSPVTPPRIDPGTVRLVAQCLNHYAIPHRARASSFARFQEHTQRRATVGRTPLDE